MSPDLLDKLRDPEHRKGYVASNLSVGIVLQLRALMKQRDMSVKQLAERLGVSQRDVSVALIPGMFKPDIEFLLRIAAVFDCGLQLRFASFSDIAREREELGHSAFNVKSFDEEVASS